MGLHSGVVSCCRPEGHQKKKRGSGRSGAWKGEKDGQRGGYHPLVGNVLGHG